MKIKQTERADLPDKILTIVKAGVKFKFVRIAIKMYHFHTWVFMSGLLLRVHPACELYQIKQ